MSRRSRTDQPTGLTAEDLWVYLLGPPGVEWAGRPLAIPRCQARALLYRLATRLQPVPREHLCSPFPSPTRGGVRGEVGDEALAHHFDAGGEVKKALHYHSLAAQRAEALFAWREAEGHQGRVLELLDRLDPNCQESTLPVCEMWSEVEAGLALLAQGEPMAALKQTGRAVALVPQAHEGWIGTEELHRAHARVLCALGRADEADEQARLADAIVEAKARCIRDPEQRWRYLESWLW